MADNDWKKRTGIEINFTTDEDDRATDASENDSTSDESNSTEEGSFDALMRDFEKLGTTPPRTRILRQTRKAKDYGENNVKKINKKHRISTISKVSSPGSDKDCSSDSKKNNNNNNHKRNMQRLRGSQRDLKLNVNVPMLSPKEDRTESLPTIKVESSNRFLSLSCKLVRAASQWRNLQTSCSKSRSEYHDKFIALVKSGNSECKDKSTCRRQASREEDLWQAELKDLIWLELQAWHADRSPTEQDEYLCEARMAIPKLLIDILNYRFIKRPEQLSAQSNDSGIHFPSPDSESPIEENCGYCSGCLWLFCPTCIEHENAALRDVEGLMQRLESAEALYPSSRAFSDQYPLYMSNEFMGRVKAMCLWYNVTRHHRLKILILGKQLLSYSQGVDLEKTPGFNYDNNAVTPNTFYCAIKRELYNIQALTYIGKHFNDGDHTLSYRKYIEDVLKLRGLRKALHFLERLHLTVLRRARISLEKPNENDEKEDPEESELRRYGHWSSEAQSLQLPSFRPAFLFISRIPLDVIHEFLRMRLETKIDRPSILSIRQIIKELKEGLRLAVLHKQRYLQHVETALCDEGQEVQERFKKPILKFDLSVQSVLELYLRYIEQWVDLTQQESVQRNILDEEWKFITSTVLHIPGGESLAGSRFCNIVCCMLQNICDQSKQRISDRIEGLLNIDADTSLKQSVLIMCRDLQSFFLEMRNRTVRVICLSKTVRKYFDTETFRNCAVIVESLDNIKEEAMNMSKCLEELILRLQEAKLPVCLEEVENSTLLSRYRDMLHQLYKFTFEYKKEVYRLSIGCERCTMSRNMIDFAQQWLEFVITQCEKGRGVRPRWALPGLDFLQSIVDPQHTQYLTDEEFEKLKIDIDNGVSHIMGSATPTLMTTPPLSYMSTRSRSASPSTAGLHHKLSYPSQLDLLTNINGDVDKPSIFDLSTSQRRSAVNRKESIISAVNNLDLELDTKLRNADLIGDVIVKTISPNDRNYIRPRPVTFGWQRGIKIGQGRFGKVYTAVNNETGELMAMKEISLQPNDIRTIRSVALELKIFEGIQHENIVRYYGAEIHREELLIFMELCTEGTLESLVAATEKGLPEGLMRRYTNQLLSAISTLHQHGIVHRDIKTANIFLTAEGNCLKLGDFGSAVKIKAHTTVPGELKGFVGTQAYMAPEVFMKSNHEGHGRAVDIWSLGCVVIEMASGKRPWSEYDSNYQIMFKVGMGEAPEIPESLSEEGIHFVSLCLQHNPKERATTLLLRDHTFLKVDMEEECLSCTMPSNLEDYLKLGIKR